MKKIDLPNLLNKVRKNKAGSYIAYYYRFFLNKKEQYISLGNSRKATVTQIKERYAVAQNKAFRLQHGLEPEVIQGSVPEDNSPKELWLKDVFPKFVNAFADKTKTFLRDLHNFKPFVVFFGDESDWQNGQIAESCKIDINKITASDIDDFYNDQYKQGFKTNTVNCRHKYLNPFYSWLTRNELIEKNIYENKTPLKSQGSDATPYQVLHQDDIKKIIASTDNPKHKILWTIVAWTGLSPVDAVNLNKATDVVSNGKFDCIITARQKTRVTAQVPILGDLAKLGDIAFTLDMTKKERDTANTDFINLAKKVGVIEKPGYKVSQYCLRHSLATFLRTYLTDNEIALLLGQKNIKQQNTYTSPESIALHEKLAGVLN